MTTATAGEHSLTYTAEGITKLCDALKANTTLKFLDLSVKSKIDTVKRSLSTA